LVVVNEMQPMAELPLQSVEIKSAISPNAHRVNSQDRFDETVLILDIKRPDHDAIASDPASGREQSNLPRPCVAYRPLQIFYMAVVHFDKDRIWTIAVCQPTLKPHAIWGIRERWESWDERPMPPGVMDFAPFGRWTGRVVLGGMTRPRARLAASGTPAQVPTGPDDHH
jgi:hypothetical protein